MKLFGNKKDYPMYIVGLNPHTGDGPRFIYQEELKMYWLPVVTNNGHFTVLPAGVKESYEDIKAHIQNQVQKLESSGVLYACVSVYVKLTQTAENLSKTFPAIFPKQLENEPLFFPGNGPFIPQVLSYNPPNPYLEQIYEFLSSPKIIGDENWHNSINSLRDESLVLWINKFIETHKKLLNWSKLVENSIEKYKDRS